LHNAPAECDLAARAIDCELADVLYAWRMRRILLHHLVKSAPHSDFELVDRKRLRQEVVGTQLETQHSVVFALGRATDDDRRRRTCLQFAAQNQAVPIWEHEVGNDEVGSAMIEQYLDFRGVGRVPHTVPSSRQRVRQHGCERGVVLDKQDVRQMRSCATKLCFGGRVLLY